MSKYVISLSGERGKGPWMGRHGFPFPGGDGCVPEGPSQCGQVQA